MSPTRQPEISPIRAAVHAADLGTSWPYPRSVKSESGLRRGCPTRPLIGGVASISRMSCVTSLRLPPVRIRASGVPCPSVIRWCFDPVLPRSAKLGPVRLPLYGAHVAGVDHRTRPVETGRRVELGRQLLMQLLPDAGVVPVPQPTPARHARPEAQLLWQVLPLDAGVRHEEDAAQHLPVGQRLASRVPKPTLLVAATISSNPSRPDRRPYPRHPLPRRAGHGHPQGLPAPAEAPLQHQPPHRPGEGSPRASPRISVRLERAHALQD